MSVYFYRRISECEDRLLYDVEGLQFKKAVFVKRYSGFIGVTQVDGIYRLAIEYHVRHPHIKGTVFPFAHSDILPTSIYNATYIVKDIMAHREVCYHNGEWLYFDKDTGYYLDEWYHGGKLIAYPNTPLLKWLINFY